MFRSDASDLKVLTNDSVESSYLECRFSLMHASGGVWVEGQKDGGVTTWGRGG